MIKILLLAGGKGSRLWPLSTEALPKQFLKLENDLSLLQNTVKRFLPRFPLSNIFVATSKEYQKLAEKQLLPIDPLFSSRILIEPCSKNTAFAIIWAIKNLKMHHELKPSDLILVSPIDHVFSDPALFTSQIIQAISLYDDNHLLAFGISAQKADPSLGYLEKGPLLFENYYQALSFIEKPEGDLLNTIYEKGWLWNLGLYLFSLRCLERELKIHCPSLYGLLTEDKEFYQESLSIDHALIKKTKHLSLYQMQNLSWLDIGSWSSLELFLENHKTQPYAG